MLLICITLPVSLMPQHVDSKFNSAKFFESSDDQQAPSPPPPSLPNHPPQALSSCASSTRSHPQLQHRQKLLAVNKESLSVRFAMQGRGAQALHGGAEVFHAFSPASSPDASIHANEPFTPMTSAVAAQQQRKIVLHSSAAEAAVDINHSPCFSRKLEPSDAQASLPPQTWRQTVAAAPNDITSASPTRHSSAFKIGKAAFEERKASFLTHLMPTPQLAHELRSMKHRVHDDTAAAVQPPRTLPSAILVNTNADTIRTGGSTLQPAGTLPYSSRPVPIMGGVGIVFGQMRDGRIVVERVIPEGPAHDVGVQAGDVLQAIDGVPALRMPFKALSCLVPGEAGTLISMTFAREMAPTPPAGPSSPTIFSCQIRRSHNVVHPVASDSSSILAPPAQLDLRATPAHLPHHPVPTGPAPLLAFVPSPLTSFQPPLEAMDAVSRAGSSPADVTSRSSLVSAQHQQHRAAFLMAPISSPSPPPHTTLQHVAQMSSSKGPPITSLAPAVVKVTPPPQAAPPVLQAGQVLLQLRDVESIIGQLQQLRTLIPELQSKVGVSQLALAEAEAKLKAREKEKMEQGCQTLDSVLVVDKEIMQQQSHMVEQQRRLLEERVRALNAATSHTDTLASELIHYQRLFACVIHSPSTKVIHHARKAFVLMHHSLPLLTIVSLQII